MSDQGRPRSTAATALTCAVARWSEQLNPPVVIAVDGHGASGKTTLVAALAELLPVSVIHADDFFVGLTPPATSRSAPAPHVNAYYDFARLREQALEPLLANRPAEFVADDRSRPDSTKRSVELEPSELIVIEGVGAAGPALADLVQRRVLITTPQAERLARLRTLIAPTDWDQRWLAAEFAYFVVDPPEFDLVISGAIGTADSPSAG